MILVDYYITHKGFDKIERRAVLNIEPDSGISEIKNHLAQYYRISPTNITLTFKYNCAYGLVITIDVTAH